MGILRRERTGERLPLASRTVVGRAPVCAWLLDGERASREHAAISWTSAGLWEVRDLGSRNGTFVEGRRIAAPEHLARGMHVAFGDAEDGWVLEDARAPLAVAYEMGARNAVAASGGVLALPSDDRPEVTLFEVSDGRWLKQEAGRDAEPLAEEEILRAAGRTFRVHLPVALEGTPIATHEPTLDEVSLTFRVPRSEEAVEIRVSSRSGEKVLPAREHGYLLLVLARRRLAEAHLESDKQGWIGRDELLRMLRIDVSLLDVLVHRARRQLGEAGIRGGAGIVEVERGRRRIGTSRVTITAVE